MLGSAVGMDKELMKAVFASAGLPQVDYLVLRDVAGARRRTLSPRVEERLGYPVFVKPANLGSSVGMTKAHDRAELGPAPRSGRRATTARSSSRRMRGPRARVQPCSATRSRGPRWPGEVVPANEFYDYEAKYTEGMMAFAHPAPMSADREAAGARAGGAGLHGHRLLRLRALRLLPRRPDGRVLVNEINTIPGMTAMSGFPRLWAASGVVDRDARRGDRASSGCSGTSARRKLMTTRLG